MRKKLETCSFEHRLASVAAFYKLPLTIVEAVAKLPMGPERREECSRAGISLSVLRTMVDYDRYFEAEQVERQVVAQCGRVVGLTVLDFGCLVADYGMYFARRGARVILYDFQENLNFARHRFAAENLAVELFSVPTPVSHLVEGTDLVIFGEVLEHLDNPMEPLRACAAAQVRYIFTSCYPYGNEKYFSLPGHSREAQRLQPICAEFLSMNYFGTRTHGKAVFWTRRDHGPIF